ncbi:cation channel sperm-associated auxiliary subunit TMEM249 [Diceros bicornis minor]|uniref:cation channel sperm-associated auxiliary subunit TMEM249 n=1 Tax=Diceros bicornis minor TaxID=77932 RepID=UPI0026EE5009|nr:cation channel sperm-associated auxiliary subunit TMEM249 [Diceros bicornis minor]
MVLEKGTPCSAMGFGNPPPKASRTRARPSLDLHLVALPCLFPERSSFLVRSPGGFLLPGKSATVGSGRWQQTSRPVDRLCLPTQAPKGRISGLPTTSSGNPFQLWALGLFCTERHLAKRLKDNSFYPFTQQQPNVFVLEYYLDTLWKGTLLFVVCLILVSFGFVSQVQKQETWGFPAYGVGVGLWLMISSLPRRRLVLNHTRGVYHFSIQGRTVCQGPMHLVYVRLALSSDAYGRCFFQLVLCGHKLEPLVLVQLSERYEQMEYLGRHIARKLNINYFDCLATSYRHVVRHWPLGAAFSPGIVLRKTGAYDKPGSPWDLDV